MKLLTFESQGQYQLGIVTEQGVLPVQDFSAPEFFADGLARLPILQNLLEQAPADAFVPESSLNLAPVVPQAGKIICIGLNYRQHAEESKMPIPTSPILFSKFSNALAAAGEEVLLNPEAKHYDYEAELVVVMGKTARNIPQADALSHVLGYCNGNDLSARDLQFRTGQWLLGKTPDQFLPIGPYLVTTDDIPNPQGLTIQTYLNGELRQDSNTADMIFSVNELIAYISTYMTLSAGDIIATGTPQGVILGEETPQWMKAGDVVAVEIQGLGRLENRLGSE